MRRIKTAVVGCGAISKVYMNSIRENFSVLDLCACSDLDQNKMEHTAQEFGIRAMDFETILESEEIEMILNLTSPAAHYTLTKEALQRGKHVYSEKMLTVEFEQAKELCEIAGKNNVRLGCAPDTFLGGGLQTARYIVDKNLIGDIHSAVISLTRDFGVYGENLPHLYKKGGSILYDMGGYYLTALCSILGPVSAVFAFGKKTEIFHEVTRVGSSLFGQKIELDDCNVVTAVLRFRAGTQVTFHMNSAAILNETFHLELYGRKGILRLGDPNTFGGRVILEKMQNKPVEFPFTHGFRGQSRGLGAAEMAWAIMRERPHRASMEMACHILEIVHGILNSIETGFVYQTTTDFIRPEALPEGFIGKGFWEPEEESALLG